MSALRQFWQPASPLADRDKFQAQGFITVRGVIDVGLLEFVLAEMDELFVIELRRLGLSVTPGGTREAFHANARELLAGDASAYRAAVGMIERLPAAHELMLASPVLRILRELGLESPLAERTVEPHISSEALKVLGGEDKTAAHQDRCARGGGADGVKVWMPLTPVSVRSHPLEVSPRSHLHGVLAVDASGAVRDERVAEESFVPLPMQPGDVVVLSNLIVHRTGERGDGSLMVAISAGFDDAADQEMAAS